MFSMHTNKTLRKSSTVSEALLPHKILSPCNKVC